MKLLQRLKTFLADAPPDDPYIRAVQWQEAQEAMVDQKVRPLFDRLETLEARVALLEAEQDQR